MLISGIVVRPLQASVSVDAVWKTPMSGNELTVIAINLDLDRAVAGRFLNGLRPTLEVRFDPKGSTDASVVSGVGSTALKYPFSRARPYQGNNPNAWFKGSGYQSFPSGDVTLQASFSTPLIANYGRKIPWIWALDALPVYDVLARLSGALAD